MILATPVLLPKIEPDDWERFWAVWHMNKRPLVKKTPTPNGMYGGKWEGFDIYHSPFFRANYQAVKVDLLEASKLFEVKRQDQMVRVRRLR